MKTLSLIGSPAVAVLTSRLQDRNEILRPCAGKGPLFHPTDTSLTDQQTAANPFNCMVCLHDFMLCMSCKQISLFSNVTEYRQKTGVEEAAFGQDEAVEMRAACVEGLGHLGEMSRQSQCRWLRHGKEDMEHGALASQFEYIVKRSCLRVLRETISK